MDTESSSALARKSMRERADLGDALDLSEIDVESRPQYPSVRGTAGLGDALELAEIAMDSMSERIRRSKALEWELGLSPHHHDVNHFHHPPSRLHASRVQQSAPPSSSRQTSSTGSARKPSSSSINGIHDYSGSNILRAGTPYTPVAYAASPHRSRRDRRGLSPRLLQMPPSPTSTKDDEERRLARDVLDLVSGLQAELDKATARAEVAESRADRAVRESRGDDELLEEVNTLRIDLSAALSREEGLRNSLSSTMGASSAKIAELSELLRASEERSGEFEAEMSRKAADELEDLKSEMQHREHAHKRALAELRTQLDEALAWGRDEVEKGRIAAADAVVRAREEADACYRRSLRELATELEDAKRRAGGGAREIADAERRAKLAEDRAEEAISRHWLLEAQLEGSSQGSPILYDDVEGEESLGIMQEELICAEERVEKLERRVEEERERAEGAERRVAEERERVEKLERRVEEEKERAEGAERRVAEERERVERLERRVEEEKERAEGAERRVAEERERVERLERRVEEEKERADRAEAKIDEERRLMVEKAERADRTEPRGNGSEDKYMQVGVVEKGSHGGSAAADVAVSAVRWELEETLERAKEAEVRAEEAHRKAEEAQQRAEEAHTDLEEARKSAEEAHQMVEEAQEELGAFRVESRMHSERVMMRMSSETRQKVRLASVTAAGQAKAMWMMAAACASRRALRSAKARADVHFRRVLALKSALLWRSSCGGGDDGSEIGHLDDLY